MLTEYLHAKEPSILLQRENRTFDPSFLFLFLAAGGGGRGGVSECHATPVLGLASTLQGSDNVLVPDAI
jgi:hypothetical protein